MKRQREFYRHVLALPGRHVNRTAAQPVGHQRTGVDVVGVIIFSLSAAVNLVRSSCPLGVVSGSFQATGQSAGVIATLYVSHASAKADSICSNHSAARSLVGADHAVELVAAFVEIEGAQVNPGASTHTLVNGKLCSFALVINDVSCIAHALGERLVAYVDCVFAGFLETGLVANQTGLLALGSLCLSHGSHEERIFPILQSGAVGKTGRIAVFPFLARLLFEIINRLDSIIIIDDDFVRLPVSFTGCEDDGSRILEHRDEVGHDDGLGEEIFVCAKQVRSLPFPYISVSIIIPSVRGP